MTTKDEMAFDPNRTPLTSPVPGFQYVPSSHGVNGKLVINSNTGVIQPIENGPGFPIEVPVELLNQDQPFVHTCGPEKRDSSGMWINRGCPAYSGCAIVQWFKDHKKPVNVIITKNGKIDSAPCFTVYCGVSQTGRPTSQVHYHMDGWHILTDRTTIPQKIKSQETGRWEEVETEVPNLAPFYAKAIAEKQAPAKKRGRPKKEPVAVDA